MKDIYKGDFDEKTGENVQEKVKSLLRIGIFFSIFWIAGIGSIISIVVGLKARNIIKRRVGVRVAHRPPKNFNKLRQRA
jgi:hypothetical protein